MLVLPKEGVKNVALVNREIGVPMIYMCRQPE